MQDFISDWNSSSKLDLEGKISLYNERIISILDKLAPVKTKTLKIKPMQPWMTENSTNEIQCRRRLERVWRADPDNIKKLFEFKKQRNHTNRLMRRAESEFLIQHFKVNAKNSKELFRTCNKLLGKKVDIPLPEHEDSAQLATEFNDFFISKIDKIMVGIDQKISAYTEPFQEEDITPPTCLFITFRKFTIKEVVSQVKQMATKSCELDPVPTWLLKEHLELFGTILTDIVNSSLVDDEVSSNLKSALVRPLLKKLNLELEKKNYRPVSNLTFISKLVERCVVIQLNEHLTKNNLAEPNQSAYRANHSTETSLLCVRTKFLENMEAGKVTCMVLLDLLAAFDTISHKLLLQRLHDMYGIRGTALKWLQNYLSDRVQQVIIDGKTSESRPLKWGVPQGSVLGPLLFTWYTAPLGILCRRHGIYYHLYADDSKLLNCFDPKKGGSWIECKNKLNKCVSDIRKWMDFNQLKLNGDKTEVIFIGTQHKLQLCNELISSPMEIDGETITPVNSVRDLGYMVDSNLKNDVNINKIMSTTYKILKDISNIRHKLDEDTTKLLVNSLVTSRIDYCNSLLVGTAKYNLNKLQKLQNMSCRVIKCLKKYDHISEQLAELHWLRIPERVDFKLACFAFKCVHEEAPSYLQDCLPPVKVHNERNLRSKTQRKLDINFCKSAFVKNSSFTFQAPRIWNSLPNNLRLENDFINFKTGLKTHLFLISHPNCSF